MLLLLASCGNGNQQNEKKVPQREGILFGEALLWQTDEYGDFTNFIVTYTTADKTIDTLFCEFPYGMDDNMIELNEGVFGRIEEEDINFDGTPDVQVCTGLFSTYGNPVYEGFVWDKENGTFVNVPEYGGIINPYINESEQSIVSMFMEWVYGHKEYTCEKYEWKEGKLVKTDEWTDNEEEYEEDEDDDLE